MFCHQFVKQLVKKKVTFFTYPLSTSRYSMPIRLFKASAGSAIVTWLMLFMWNWTW